MFTPTLSDAKSISTKFLKRHCYLIEGIFRRGSIVWSRNGKETGSIGLSVDSDKTAVTFNYTSIDNYTGTAVNKDYSVNLLTTKCNYGGVRYWFECPFCKSRMGTLYLYGKNDFTCRKCLQLPYKSQNASGVYREVGETMNFPQLEEFRAKIRPYYNGKMTRNYKRYLRQREKLMLGIFYFNSRMELQLARMNKRR